MKSGRIKIEYGKHKALSGPTPWAILPQGTYFVSIDEQGYINIIGCKLSERRYFDLRLSRVLGFYQNSFPADMLCYTFTDPVQILIRQRDYLYFNSPDDLRHDFSKGWPDHDLMDGIYRGFTHVIN